MLDILLFWADKNIDGFRCDMAMLVPIEFWQEAARWLRAVKPDLFLLAEAEEDYLFDRGFRRVVCLAALSPDERRGAAEVPGRSYSGVSLCRSEARPGLGFAADVHFES